MAVIKVFLDTSMGLGIPGLRRHLDEQRIAVDAAAPNDMFMFLNRNRNQCKILWNGNMLFHLRKEGAEITIEELKKVPSFFRHALLGEKMEKQLNKYINKRVNVSVDEDGLKVV